MNIPAQTSSNFITTFTGRRFWPLNPNPDEIDIEDIAHSLSLQCRFTGHCREFYSVAQHSVSVSRLAQQSVEDTIGKVGRDHPLFTVGLWGLLHDASEAYLCDLSSPIKYEQGIGEHYRFFEQRLMRAVCQRFELAPAEPAAVKMADRMMLRAEMCELLKKGSEPSLAPAVPRIRPQSPTVAKDAFLTRFYELYGK